MQQLENRSKENLRDGDVRVPFYREAVDGFRFRYRIFTRYVPISD
jgi:hypothetical protein